MAHSIDRLIPNNDEAPHRSVIWITAEVHELLKTGECSGIPKYKVERFPVYIDGADKFIAIRKLNEILASLKQQCAAGCPS